MSRTLREVLDEYAEKYQSRHNEIRKTINEWVDAIEELLDQCKCWLKEVDKDNVLRIEEDNEEIPEEPLGRYQVPILVIRVGTAEVKIRPIRRTVSRPHLVDLPSTPEGRAELVNHLGLRYLLFRLKEDKGMRWVILHPETRKVDSLTRETFEDAMARLLG